MAIIITLFISVIIPLSVYCICEDIRPAIFALFVYYFFKYFNNFFIRITSIEDLPLDVSGICLYGKATFVCDGDGFKFFHTPFFRSSEYTRGDEKLTIRLAGIDAPEAAQPFAFEAKNELMELILKKEIQIKLLGIDIYNRLLAMCYVENWFSTTNVNMKMVELGMACVYKGKDAIYDDYKNELRKLEAIARKKKLGMWAQDNYISPMKYKKMHRK